MNLALIEGPEENTFGENCRGILVVYKTKVSDVSFLVDLSSLLDRYFRYFSLGHPSIRIELSSPAARRVALKAFDSGQKSGPEEFSKGSIPQQPVQAIS